MLRKRPDPPTYPTITELLKNCAAGRGEQTLFVEERPGGCRVTYDQWSRDLLETAEKIQQLEAQHIGLVCDLTYSCILCMYSVLVAGKVLVLLEADLEAEALEKYIRKADVDLVLYHEERVDGAISCCDSLQIPEFLSRPATGNMSWPTWEDDREACIVFTSGTEGETRAVMLTQRNLSLTNSYSKYTEPDKQPRILLFLPIHHVFALFTTTTCICEGTRIHLSRNIRYVSRELETVKPDALISVPLVNDLIQSKIQKGLEESGKAKAVARLVGLSNFLRKLGLDLRIPLFQKLRDSLGGVPQLFITGAAAVSEESFRFFDDIGIFVLQSYGMTETFGTISSNSLEENRMLSVGHPHPLLEVRIQDSEIQVRGPSVMKGYYKDPKATAEVFQDGWFRTGDLGYFDEDGFLFLTGRKKNLIILAGGENISPEELENQLLSGPGIAEVVVREREGKLHAEIYPDPDTPEDTIRDAIAQLNRKNPLYKRITSWELRAEPFEKTSSTKIRR